jgi:hypothetical protein
MSEPLLDAPPKLRATLPRLQQRLLRAQAAEYAAKWAPDFEQVEDQRSSRPRSSIFSAAWQTATARPRALTAQGLMASSRVWSLPRGERSF